MYLCSPYPPVPPIPPTNYHNLLFRGPDQVDMPDHVMQIDGITGQKRTRYEFLERVYDGATALGGPKEAGGLGFTSNDIIGIMSDNCLDYIAIVHSLLAITTPFALISTYATPREMTHSLTKSKVTHIFVHTDLLSQLLPVARELGFPEDHIYILESRLKTAPAPLSFDQLIQNIRYNNIPREPVREAAKDTLAYLVFSSGTSGLPKAVMISHGNLNFSLVQSIVHSMEAVKIMNPPPDPDGMETVLSFLPFFHSYGLHFSCLRAPMRPSTHVIMPRWDLKLALSLIPKYRVSMLPAIPSIVHQLVHSPLFEETDLSSLDTIICGAAYLPPKLARKFRLKVSANVSFSEGYGMSEATITLMGRPREGILEGRVESVLESTGILGPGLEAMILRPDGTHCLPNEPGDLYVKGDNVALGYWNDREATKESFVAYGWLRTGDRFRANGKGTFWFEDRAKDTLKVSGMQVSPAEIEDVLLDEPSGIVQDVAVAGVQTPGARTSDDRSPRAWIVLSMQGQQMGERQAREALIEWVEKNLSKYKWLRGGIQFVQEIPKNPTGKILRRMLQDQYASMNESSQAKL